MQRDLLNYSLTYWTFDELELISSLSTSSTYVFQFVIFNYIVRKLLLRLFL